MRKLVLTATAIGGILIGGAAFASDHLANGATAPGNSQRGFGNPVATNPSDTSGPHAMPASVPGEGNPNAGQDMGVPAVNSDLLRCQAESLPFDPDGCGLD